MIDVLIKLNYVFSKDQKKKLIILSLLLFFGMILEVFGLGIIVPLLSTLTDSQSNLSISIFSTINRFFPQMTEDSFLFFFLFGVIIIYFFKTFFLIFLTFKQNRFLNYSISTISNTLFSGYLLQPYSFHLNKNASVLIKNIQVEISSFYTFLLALITIIIEGGFVLSIILTLIYIEPLGALSIGLFFSLLSVIFLKFTKKKINQWGELRQKIDGQLVKTALEGFGGIKDIIIFGKASYYIDIFSNQNYAKARVASNNATVSQIPRFYLELVSIIGLVLFIILLLIQEKDVSSLFTILGVFVAATFRMIPSFNRIISASQTMKFYNSSLDIVFNEIKLISKLPNFKISNEKSNFTNTIEFKDVNFKFKKGLDILRGINLKIEKGETIGIIGESGSGKSTLVDLLIGFHSPISGDIFIDGVSGCQNEQSWRNIIGYVSQTIYLTDDTIKNNIAFGLSENQINEERIKELLKIVNLENFVNNLELGLDTKVGERGVQLSGGQRQRIGIARALYHNPQILVLDEATASLDVDTESKIMKSIYKLKGQKTIIIIAHRLSTLENCDSVYEISKGLIIKKFFK